MTEVQDIIEFVELERKYTETEQEGKSLIQPIALEWIGHAILDIELAKTKENTLILKCLNNNSRFRPGDRLIFTHPAWATIKGTLLGIMENGRTLIVKGKAQSNAIGTKGWTAIEDYSDLTYSVQNALRKIQPGAPGWTFTQRMLGKSETPIIEEGTENKQLLHNLIEETGVKLDESQISAILKCLSRPPIIGIQGPPGTGKTIVLAFVAEALLRYKKRVVILAPTHQAVNNALTTLKRLFPTRNVKKYGDEVRTESLDDNISIITSPKEISKEPTSTIIGFTFMAAIHQMMISEQKILSPHAVIIDEAGQVPISQGICTGLTGAGSIMMFGDDMQMPPVFPSELSEEALGKSIFSQLRTTQPKALMMLDTTYRLNQELCDVIGNTFYNEEQTTHLRPSEQAKNRIFSINLKEKKKEDWLIDTLNSKNSIVWLKINNKNKTQYNPEEAEIAANIIATCMQQGMTQNEIAMVTPFRRQAMQTRNKLKEILGEEKDIPIIDTVERVQGLTVEMIIISMCSSDLQYITSIAEFIFSPNRMNVAISRAKTKAIIISNPRIFDVTPKSIEGLDSRNKCKKLFQNIQLKLTLN